MGNNSRKKAEATAFNKYRDEKSEARRDVDGSSAIEILRFFAKWPNDGWKRRIKNDQN